jgi:hypothetical protein
MIYLNFKFCFPQEAMKRLSCLFLLVFLFGCQSAPPPEEGAKDVEEKKEEPPQVIEEADLKIQYPNTSVLFKKKNISPVEWNKSLMVRFSYDISASDFRKNAKVFRINPEDKENKEEEVQIDIEVASPTEYYIHGTGAEYLWDPGYSYTFFLPYEFLGQTNRKQDKDDNDFRKQFLTVPSQPFYVSDIQWRERFQLVDEKLLTDEYELIFSQDPSPEVQITDFHITPEGTEANIVREGRKILVQGNFAPDVSYRLYVEALTDTYGREFHFPFIELPPNEEVQEEPEPKLFSLEQRKTFFFTKENAPELLLKKGASQNKTKVTLCRINRDRETTFHETPMIYMDYENRDDIHQYKKQELDEQAKFKEDLIWSDCVEKNSVTITFTDSKIQRISTQELLKTFSKPFGIFAIYLESTEE